MARREDKTIKEILQSTSYKFNFSFAAHNNHVNCFRFSAIDKKKDAVQFFNACSTTTLMLHVHSLPEGAKKSYFAHLCKRKDLRTSS